MNFTQAKTFHVHQKLPYSLNPSLLSCLSLGALSVSLELSRKTPFCSCVSVHWDCRSPIDSPSRSDASPFFLQIWPEPRLYLFEVISCLTPTIWCLWAICIDPQVCSLNTLFGSSVAPAMCTALLWVRAASNRAWRCNISDQDVMGGKELETRL